MFKKSSVIRTHSVAARMAEAEKEAKKLEEASKEDGEKPKTGDAQQEVYYMTEGHEFQNEEEREEKEEEEE